MAVRKATKRRPDPIERLAQHLLELTGIRLTPAQQPIVRTRLQRRLQFLGIPDLEGYVDYLEANYDTEAQEVVSLLTTHHTYFFREFRHFEFISQQALPQIIAAARLRPDRTIRVWSAGCSFGHEVYSLAMLLDYHLKQTAPDITYEIVGSDIDPNCVSTGANGVYQRRDVQGVPLYYLANHWAKGTGAIEQYVKAKDSLRSRCRFEVSNLLQLHPDTRQAPFDLILCRNVFIYFETPRIQQISTELLQRLTPEGFLIVGLSESLMGLGLPVKSLGPSVYVHANAAKPKAVTSVSKTPAPVNVQPRNLRVLCVDDSIAVHRLLQEVLTPDEGFEIVATAMNGREARDKLKAHAVDLMTLDIHMPEQTGLEYLRDNFGPNHPPVVMLSSVMRESAETALESLRLGASDYVQKPALDNLLEAGEEIRAKLKTAFQERQRHSERSLQLDQATSHPLQLKNPEKKARILIGTLAVKEKLIRWIQALRRTNEPPTVVLFEGIAEILPSLAAEWKKQGVADAEILSATTGTLSPGKLYLGDAASQLPTLLVKTPEASTSILLLGGTSNKTLALLRALRHAQVLLEETAEPVAASLQVDTFDIVPLTSMLALSDQFLSESES